MVPELASRRHESRIEQSLVDEVEELPHGIRRDHHRRLDVPDEIRAIDRDDAARAPSFHNDLHGLPTERDDAAPRADRPCPWLHQALLPAGLVVDRDERARFWRP